MISFNGNRPDVPAWFACLVGSAIITSNEFNNPIFGAERCKRARGEDVLGFCMLTPAPNTTGLWHLALEGQSRGLPRNGTLGFAATEDGEITYHMSKAVFPAGKNNILPLPMASGPLGASVFNFTANGLTKLVDSIDYLP